MANTAINHDPAATFPGSSTDTAVVKWSGTGGKTLANSGVTIDASNNLTVPGNITTTGYIHLTGDTKELRFYENGNFIAIKAPSLGADYTLTLPINDGATDEYLQTNGSGVLTWAAAGGTTVAGTTDNSILTFVNSGSTFAAEANLTFDGTGLAIGMGATSPVGRLEVEDGGVSGNTMVKFTTDDQGPYALVIGNDTYSTGNQAGISFYQKNDGTSNISVNDTIGLSVAPDGSVIMPNQPAFLFTNVGTDTNVTGNGTPATIDFNNEIFDQGGDFASDIFTAPVSGNYFFVAHVATDGSTTSGGDCVLQIVTTDVTHLTVAKVPKELVGALMYLKISTFVDMDSGDTCRIKLTVSGEAGNTTDIQQGTDRTHFSGYLVN